MLQKTIRLILLSSLLIFSTSAIYSKALEDQEAPDIELTFSDKSAMLSDYKGQVVYLDFWASWCKPCRRSFPWMDHIQNKFANLGFKVIAVNLDAEPALANKFLKQLPVKFDIAYDHKGVSAEIYDIQSMPSSYLIDRKGNLRIGHKGFFVNKQDKYEQEIKSLLAEKE